MDQPNVASIFYGPVLLAAEESAPRTDWRQVTLDATDIGKSITGDPATLRFSDRRRGAQAVLRDVRAPLGLPARDAEVTSKQGRPEVIQSSDAVRVALAPTRAYSELVGQPHAPSSWFHALAGPALYGLVLGAALSIAATHVASVVGVVSVALFWSFVPAVQLFTAWIVCRNPSVPIELPRAIELFFLIHLPWSMWLIAAAAGTFWFAPGPTLVQGVVITALVPLVWTPVMIAAFCRAVLGCSVRDARRRYRASHRDYVGRHPVSVDPCRFDLGAVRGRGMTIARGSAALVFCVGLLAGTLLDRGELAGAAGSDILAADLHVHGGVPLDATLPPWELQREARRRGLDVIAIVGHNQTVVTLFESILSSDVIVLPGVEVGNAGLHLIAAGVRETIGWRLKADEAIDATHREGGVAIAAHPVRRSWLTHNERALRELDGVEAAHPLVYVEPDGRQDLIEFWSRASAAKPTVAPIGSSDFHGLPDMGACRTYLFVKERSARGVLEAIRNGRTVASDGRGALTGSADLVKAVEAHLATMPVPLRSIRETLVSGIVLLALVALLILK